MKAFLQTEAITLSDAIKDYSDVLDFEKLQTLIHSNGLDIIEVNRIDKLGCVVLSIGTAETPAQLTLMLWDEELTSEAHPNTSYLHTNETKRVSVWNWTKAQNEAFDAICNFLND